MAVAKKRPASKGKAVVKKTVKKKAAPEKKAPVRKTARHATAAKPAVKKKAVAPKKTSAKTSAAAAAPASAQAAPYLDGIEPYKEKKGEAYMNSNQVAHFRNILKAWKHKLIEEMERTVHHMRDEAANFPDPNDRASQESDFALELRTRDRERKLIKKIDESLRDLDNEDYGYCEVCGVEIGIRRLEARPTANLCIDCKTLDEIRERQVKG